MGLWFHSMYEIRKLHCVLDEENGNIVPDNVPVALRYSEYQWRCMVVAINDTQRV